MAANTIPIFIAKGKTSATRLTSANTARDGSGTLSTVFTAGLDGSRVDYVLFVSAQATAAASSAMVGRVFVTDTSGLNPRLIAEVALPTITASNTVIGQTQTVFFANGLMLESGQLLLVSKSVHAGVQDQYDVIARGGDY